MWLILIVVALLGYAAWVKFDPSPPQARLRQPVEFLGRRSQIEVDVTDFGSGLSSVEVSLDARGTRYEILSESYPAVSWRGSGVREKSFTLPIDAREAKIPEGQATLTVWARDGSWLNYLVTRPPTYTQAVAVDVSPPTIEVLTAQHYMRLGGSDVVMFKTSKDAVRIGVEVDRYFFPAVKGGFPDPDLSAGLFAVPQDLTISARPKVVAEDRAGNRREADFFVSIKPHKFAERTLDVNDDFLKRKVPDLLETNRLPPTDDLVAGYLKINRELRKQSEEIVRKVCSPFEPKRLWNEPF
ncbi:MAG: hypothetical protein ACREQQ_18915, partial [Candidatus Binatia bacterium]